MIKHCTKVLAVLSAVIVTAASLSLGSFRRPETTVSAKTLKEIEQEKKEKQAQIDAKKEELAELANDINSKAAYEQTLQEEIELINGKMLLIDTQITNLIGEISDKEAEIADLQQQIAEEELAVEQGLILFKKRIRTLYVHGNDSLLSALVGASSFYDVLSQIDIIKRISKHDDEMIDNLNQEIQTLTNHQQDLTASVRALNLQMTEIELLQDEFQVSRNELNSAISETNGEIQYLILQQEDMEGDLNQQQLDFIELSEEEERMISEAIRKAMEEEERQKAADAAKLTTTTKATTQATAKATTKTTTKTTTKATTKAITTAAPAAVTTAVQPQPSQPTVTTAAPVVTEAPKTQPTTVPTTEQTTKTTPTTTTQAAPSGSMFAWPCPGYYVISSPFGWRWGRNHNGIDIIGNTPIKGSPARAAGNGEVIVAKHGSTGYGNYVIIYHGNGYSTLYGHMLSLSVSQGDKVTVGQQIGVVGDTGNVTGPHMHFEVRIGYGLQGTAVDPMPYLP